VKKKHISEQNILNHFNNLTESTSNPELSKIYFADKTSDFSIAEQANFVDYLETILTKT